MTRKRRRLILLLACGVGLSGATALTLSAFSDNLVFFVSPSDLVKSNPGSRSVRLGGLVAQGSLERSSGGQPTARFKVTDGAASVEVAYKGILPDLFREGQGVVALGSMQPDGVFRASEVLAKHDESYMPKEVADALKRSGRWNPAAGPPPPASTWNAALGNAGVGGGADGNAPAGRANSGTGAMPLGTAASPSRTGG
jgi:cytochrome c-type biogenesis protein CcmE